MSEYFEKIHIPFDHQQLCKEFIASTRTLPPVMMGKHFGGWSVTASTASYSDGWVQELPPSSVEAKTIAEVRENNLKLNFKGPQYYRTPTELCTGEIKKVIDFLSTEDYFPCRARYTVLKAGCSLPFHRDYPEWLYGVRLHIPIITNKSCFFEYAQEKRHLAADGSAYLLKINMIHRVINEGDKERVHFICDFFDLKQKTQFNKFTAKDQNIVGGQNPKPSAGR